MDDPKTKIDSKKKIIVTICFTACAVIFISVGTFYNGWWERSIYLNNYPVSNHSRTVIKYGLWEKVVCDKVCFRQNSDSTGWIIFTRLMGVSGIVLCGVSLLLQAAFLFTERHILRIIAVCCSGVCGALLFLTALIISGEFYKLALTVNNRLTNAGSVTPDEVLRFCTLPLGLFFLCSLTSTITAIFLMANLSKPVKAI